MLVWCANKLIVAGAPDGVGRFVATNRGRAEDYAEEIAAGGIPLSLAAGVPYPSGWREDRGFHQRQWCKNNWGAEMDLGYDQTLVCEARAWDATYEFTTPDDAPLEVAGRGGRTISNPALRAVVGPTRNRAQRDGVLPGRRKDRRRRSTARWARHGACPSRISPLWVSRTASARGPHPLGRLRNNPTNGRAGVCSSMVPQAHVFAQRDAG